MRNIKLIGLTALAALPLIAGSAATAGGRGVARVDPPADVSPPVPYIRAAKRQDMDYVFKKGIQTTCGTEDDEHGVVCTMSASWKGDILVSETGPEIVYPYNRNHFQLKLDPRQQRKIRKAVPVAIKLELEVSDRAGNVGTAEKVTRIVKDRYHR